MCIFSWEPNLLGLKPYSLLHNSTHNVYIRISWHWQPGPSLPANENKVKVCFLLLLFFIFGTKCPQRLKVCARPASHNQGLLQWGTTLSHTHEKFKAKKKEPQILQDHRASAPRLQCHTPGFANLPPWPEMWLRNSV